MFTKILVFLSTVFIPISAFAASSINATDVKEALLALAVDVIYVASPVVLAIVGLMLKRLTDWIATKTHNEKTAGIITRLDDSLMRGLQYTTAMYVEGIRKAKLPDSPGGVSLTQEEKDEAMQMALNATRIFLGEKGAEEMNYIFGNDKEKQEEALKMKAEAFLKVQKSENANKLV